jgi:hypothetical protein
VRRAARPAPRPGEPAELPPKAAARARRGHGESGDRQLETWEDSREQFPRPGGTGADDGAGATGSVHGASSPAESRRGRSDGGQWRGRHLGGRDRGARRRVRGRRASAGVGGVGAGGAADGRMARVSPEVLGGILSSGGRDLRGDAQFLRLREHFLALETKLSAMS